MRILLIFSLMFLVIMVAGAPAQVGAQDAGAETPACGESPGAVTCFKDRHDLSKGDAPEFIMPSAASSAVKVCVPDQKFNAYGFFNLRGTEAQVDFGVYTRLELYSVTPNALGNISVPKDVVKVTKEAHKHGGKVDLVISNDVWEADDKENGLRFTKSYVLLNMVDEIVDAVSSNNFDGVTIDFHLPADKATQDSFTFFIKRLKVRLGDDAIALKKNDLLKVENKQLNVVIDNSFATALAAIAESDSQTALDELIGELSASVDLLLVERSMTGDKDILSPPLEKQVENSLNNIGRPEEDLPIDAVIFPNENVIFNARNIKITEVGIWDVANANAGLRWDEAVRSHVFGTGDAKQFISDIICTRRGLILNALTGAAPLLLVLLGLSWVFYDFPKVVNKSVSNVVLWGLLGIVVVVFILLLYGLPSLDLRNTGVYVIVASFVVPLIYIIWTVLNWFGRRDYP